MTEPPALLALEDGAVFRGTAWGAHGTAVGEVCFNTGMTGYQEVLTDPSYRGQIVAMTAPHVGNTGVNGADAQSRRPWVAGFAVRDASPEPSSWRSEKSLDRYLRDGAVPAISELDTRRLTRHLRQRGALRGTLTTESVDAGELVDRARAYDYVGRDLVAEVTTERPYRWGRADLEARLAGARGAAGAPNGVLAGARGAAGAPNGVLAGLGDATPMRVAVLDFGIKRNTLDLLAAAGCEVTVCPATTPASVLLEERYDAVFLSNGPGNPERVPYAVDTARALLGRTALGGICLGHQILALALGGATYKLPFGHRGSNHPVKRLGGERVEITCQNHGFAVDAASLAPTRGRVTHVNLNDDTVEGLEVEGAAEAVQYHPEAGPGPHDSRSFFGRLRRLAAAFEPDDAALAGRSRPDPPGREPPVTRRSAASRVP